MKKNTLLIIVLGICWIFLVIWIFTLSGKKEKTYEYPVDRVYSVDSDTMMVKRIEKKRELPPISAIPSETETVTLIDTTILSKPSSLLFQETLSATSEESAGTPAEKKSSKEIKDIELPSRYSILKDNIEFLRKGSKSAYQVRLRAYNYKKVAENYRELADEISRKGGEPELISELISTAEFLDSIALKLERTQGVKSRMKRLAGEMETVLPYMGK